MTYTEAINAAQEGLPVKSWYIDGSTKIETVYQRITRVGVWFIEKNGALVPSEYVELLSVGGSVVHSAPESCEVATTEELKAVVDKANSEWYKRVVMENRYPSGERSAV